MPLRKVLENVRSSLWFIPGVLVILAGATAFAMIAIDQATPHIGEDLPLVFGGGSDGARGLLSSIAGSMITVAGVVFSITIIALQLASSQFSPRVLRNFMRDMPSQLTLGSLLGAFVYAILVLRSVRASEDEGGPFVPGLAISLGIVLTLVALGMLVFFIHHIATKIQVSTIVATVASDGQHAIETLWARDPPEEADLSAIIPDEPPSAIPARSSGYLQIVTTHELVEIASERRALLRLEQVPGDWVDAGTGIVSVWPASAIDPELIDGLNDRLGIGKERSMQQDVAYAPRQLVDVALRALSPSVNDPTSAVECIHRLGQLLLLAGRRNPPGALYRDEGGEPRLIIDYPGFPTLLDLAFDEIRRHAAGQPRVVLELVRVLTTLCHELPPEHHAALRAQARLLEVAANQIEPERDRQPVLEALGRLTD
jgi:uncharacterized membrane protein